MTSSELQKIFSANLKAARVRAGLSQMKLAEKANLSVGYIFDLESGRRWGTLETFCKLAAALDIHAYELLLPFSYAKSLEENDAQKTAVKDYRIRLHKILLDTLSPSITKAISDAMLQADTY